jgi:hypothetical protein
MALRQARALVCMDSDPSAAAQAFIELKRDTLSVPTQI